MFSCILWTCENGTKRKKRFNANSSPVSRTKQKRRWNISSSGVFVYRKPLARPMVRKKVSAVDDDRKTPFAMLNCGLTTATKQKEVIR